MISVKIGFLALVTIIGYPCIAGNMSNRLKTFDTLHYSDLEHHHVQKRSMSQLHESYSNQRIVSFTVLGRKFKIHLQKQRNLFARDFKASVHHHNSSSSDIHIDPSDFYTGFVADEPRSSRVRAYYENNNLVASIWCSDDTYSIEPSWRHLPQSDDYTMIAYRASDLKRDKKLHPESHIGESFCGFVHPDHDEAAYKEVSYSVDESNADSVHSHRNKRQATLYNTCPVMLVADYHFFEDVGDGDLVGAAKYLIGVLARVDAIYRKTDFGDNYNDLGFELKGLIINEGPTTGYNAQQSSWETTPLLTAFSKENWRGYCLAHLFTNLAFSDGVLGLGWVASKQTNQAGGICSPVAGGMYYNTAWTSLSNKAGNRLLTQESDLVTAHEFGHNWGSSHDPDSSECSPGSDGKYLMYTYSVSGYASNNDDFSPCSKRSILEVLKAKSLICFTEKSSSYCGNQNVEEGEECDAGTLGAQGNDACCDENCMFKDPAVCSDVNSKCCSGCQYIPRGEPCSGSEANNITCDAPASCTGSSPECPVQSYKVNGSPCIDGGECRNGTCFAFCEANDLTSCICSEEADSCKVCCKSDGNPCEVYGASSGQPAIDLSDGKSCTIGACENGECKKSIRNTNNRVWSIVEDLTFDSLLVGLKNNVVMATLFISLIIYVPLAAIVFIIDWRREKKDKKEVEWRSRHNNQLSSGTDKKHIRSGTRRAARRGPGQSSQATVSGVEFAAF